MIQIENLTVSFEGAEVVKKVSIELKDGEILGVVGESGSGKSVTALTLMGLVSEEATVKSGRILFDGEVLREAGKPVDKALYRKYQGEKMSMIFQEPMTSLNPTRRVGAQVEEMLHLHRKMTAKECKDLVLSTFTSVGLKNVEKIYRSYPHQLSGGMRQRVMIAMAVILNPRLIVADEPTTALDVSVQNQIIELLKEINQTHNNTMLFITHDLNLAKRLCHRVAVMQDGEIVELGTAEEIFERPKQDYTKKLIEAVPSGMHRKHREIIRENPVVQVRDLSVFYRDGDNSLFTKKKDHQVVYDANFEIFSGESLGLVGESGCGKTSLSKAILGMNRNINGHVEQFTVRPQMIFQDPYSSLNPTKTVGWLLQEPLRAAAKLDPARALSKVQMEEAAYDMLHKVGMKDKYFDRTPFQLSGGQRQRISIAQALITHPGFIVADEPVSALDVTIQAQIMELMQKLQEEMKVAYLFISHDINVVYQMCDRIMVMKDGRIVEVGLTEDVFTNPQNPYTKDILSLSQA